MNVYSVMSRRHREWLSDVIFGLICALICMAAFPAPAYAYVDPSVMTYTIQALAGVAVALSAVAGVVFRRLRRKIQALLHIDADSRKIPDPEWLFVCSGNDQSSVEIDAAITAAEALPKLASQEDPRLNKWGYRFVSKALLPIVFFVITIGIVQPSQLYLGNINEFMAPFSEIAPVIALASICLFAGLCLFTALFVKQTRIAAAIIFGVGVAAFIQGNFLNGSMPQLDGRAVDWSSYTFEIVVSTLVWLICLALPILLAIRREALMKTIGNVGSACLSIVQVFILVALFFTTNLTPVSSEFISTTSGQFTVSQNENTIVFVLDTLDATWFESYMARHPEATERLRGFTFFDDAVAGGAPTILGMPTMLTGQFYDCNEPIAQYQKRAYASSRLFEALSEAGYSSKMFTPYTYLDGVNPEHVDNVKPTQQYGITSKTQFGKKLYRLTAVYIAPQVLKQLFWFDGSVFSTLVQAETAAGEVDYQLDDPKFYQDFQQAGLTTEDTKGDFILYHLFGAHGYYTMDENAQRIPEERSEQARANQIDGAFKIVFDYLEQLEALGVYDQSTVIITADHGGVDLYQNPTILVKPSGSSATFKTSSAPVTFANLYATYAQSLLGGTTEFGESLFQVSPDLKITRYHAADTVLAVPLFPDNKAVQSLGYVQVEIPGSARDTDAITVITNPDARQK